MATSSNLMDYGLALGRRFRALKLWMVIRAYGARRAGRDRSPATSRWRGSWRAGSRPQPGWELLAPVPLSTVCFRRRPPGVDDERRARPAQRRPRRTRQRTAARRSSHTRKVAGRYAIAHGDRQRRQPREHVERTWDALRAPLRRAEWTVVAGSSSGPSTMATPLVAVGRDAGGLGDRHRRRQPQLLGYRLGLGLVPGQVHDLGLRRSPLALPVPPTVQPAPRMVGRVGGGRAVDRPKPFSTSTVTVFHAHLCPLGLACRRCVVPRCPRCWARGVGRRRCGRSSCRRGPAGWPTLESAQINASSASAKSAPPPGSARWTARPAARGSPATAAAVRTSRRDAPRRCSRSASVALPSWSQLVPLPGKTIPLTSPGRRVRCHRWSLEAIDRWVAEGRASPLLRPLSTAVARRRAPICGRCRRAFAVRPGLADQADRGASRRWSRPRRACSSWTLPRGRPPAPDDADRRARSRPPPARARLGPARDRHGRAAARGAASTRPATRRAYSNEGYHVLGAADRGGVGHRLPRYVHRGGAAAAGHGCVPAAAGRGGRPRARGAGPGPGRRPVCSCSTARSGGAAASAAGGLLRDRRGVRQAWCRCCWPAARRCSPPRAGASWRRCSGPGSRAASSRTPSCTAPTGGLG